MGRRPASSRSELDFDHWVIGFFDLLVFVSPQAKRHTIGVLATELKPLFIFSKLAIIVFYSLLLGIFNLLPVPPLDGSKVLFSVLPKSWLSFQIILEQYGFFILLIFLLFGFPWLSPILNWLFHLLTGWTI